MKNSVDVVVVGAGAAGVAAALSAARAGCSTLILDGRPGPGGTGGFSGLTTLCGLFDEEGQWLNDGFAREFAEAIAAGPPTQMGRLWVLSYRPSKFREQAQQLLGSTANLLTSWNTPVTVVRRDSARIASLNEIAVGAVIDCSGTAEVARLAGAECFATDENTQAPAVLFVLGSVRRSLTDVADAAKVLLPLARAGFSPLNLQRGLDPETVNVKFTGKPDQVPALITFLRAKIPGFEECQPLQKDFAYAQRAGRMVIGQYVLTGADVRAGERFADSVARCAWPIEQWNAEGRVCYDYLPKGSHYEIPGRCLQSRDVPNLFMAGKTISADVDAIASARVMGCCLATGSAAGQLAFVYLGKPQGVSRQLFIKSLS